MARKRIKPEGEAWDALVEEYYDADHDGKIAIAERLEVHPDTLKHWISDAGATRKPKEYRMKVPVPELLAAQPSVDLDFVSFDIETSNLNADFSVLLTSAIKPWGKEAIIFRADDYPTWKDDRANDFQITKDTAEELRKHAIVITHYGQYFDIPFLRAKMQKHGLEPLPQKFAIDTWQVARKNFKVSSRRLKNLGDYFELGHKEGVEGPLWMDAAYNGSREAMDKIVEHNRIDVEVLEKLAAISFNFLRSIPKL